MPRFATASGEEQQGPAEDDGDVGDVEDRVVGQRDDVDNVAPEDAVGEVPESACEQSAVAEVLEQ